MYLLYYDGKTKSFAYSNEDTDLFSNLKNLMPGDIKTQKIYVDLNNIGIDSNMYLKLTTESKILDELIIKIYKNEKLIFDNKNDVGSYDELINIYTEKDSNKFYLKTIVEVPKELGNELQDLTASFKWSFIVEDSGKYIEVPNTSSDSRIYMYFILMFISLIMLIILSISILKTKKNN